MISSSLGPLPDNAQHSQETNIHAPAGFEKVIPGIKRRQSYALDLVVTEIGLKELKIE
jgi:hypothetical protein